MDAEGLVLSGIQFIGYVTSIFKVKQIIASKKELRAWGSLFSYFTTHTFILAFIAVFLDVWICNIFIICYYKSTIQSYNNLLAQEAAAEIRIKEQQFYLSKCIETVLALYICNCINVKYVKSN